MLMARMVALFRTFIPFLLILFYVSFVYSRLLFDGPATMIGESTAYNTYAVAALYNGFTHFGQLLLWDNQIGSGSTAIGNPFYQQTNPLIYPLMLIFKQNFLLMDRAYFFIHILMSAYFFYLLARYIKVGTIASVVGTITYISSQYLIAFTMDGGFRTDMVYITWLPLVLLLLLISFDKLNILAAILTGLIFSMFVHEGAGFNTHLALIFLMIFSFVYLSFQLFSKKTGNKLSKILGFSKILIFILLFSFMFSAIRFLPIAEFLQNSNRSAYSLKEAEAGITWSQYKDNLLLPYLTRFFWSIDTDAKTARIFWLIHAVFYFLVFLSIFSKNKKVAIPLIVLSVLAIVIGAAQNFPVDLYALFYNFFPGFKSVRLPPRFLVYLWLTLPLLAALGLDQLVKLNCNKTMFFKSISILSILAVVVAVPIIAFHAQKQILSVKYFSYIPSRVDNALKKLKDEDSAFHRIFVAFQGANYTKNTMPMYRYTAVLEDGFPDMAMNIYHDSRPYYYDFYDYDNDFIFASNKVDRLKIASKRWSIFNTKYFVLSDNFLPASLKIVENPYVKVAQVLPKSELEPQATIIEVPNIRPRFAFIPQGILYIGEGIKTDQYNVGDIRKIVFNDNFDIKKETVFRSPTFYLDDYDIKTLIYFRSIILGRYSYHDKDKAGQLLREYQSQGGEVFSNLNSVPDKMAAKVIVDPNFKINNLKETPGTLRVDLESNDKGFFVYSNLYYPGWEARLDGEKIPVYMADSYVKGVVIPTKGKHTLVMYYSPKSFYIGAAITGFAFSFLIYLLIRQLKTALSIFRLGDNKIRKETPPEEYNKKYLLSNYVEGFQEYKHKALSAVKIKQLQMLDLKEGLSIIEVGFGRGELLYHCSKKGVRIAGIDYSKDAYSIAKNLLGGILGSDLKIADARNIPFKSGSFDRVFAGDVIEHLNFIDGILMLKEMYRVVKPGGFMMIHTAPNTIFTRVTYQLVKYPLKLVSSTTYKKLESHLKKGDELHLNEYNILTLRKAAEKAGLKGVKIWIDEDILRSGKYKFTKSLYNNPLVHFINGFSKYSIVRFLLGNDIYLICVKPRINPTSKGRRPRKLK